MARSKLPKKHQADRQGLADLSVTSASIFAFAILLALAASFSYFFDSLKPPTSSAPMAKTAIDTNVSADDGQLIRSMKDCLYAAPPSTCFEKVAEGMVAKDGLVQTLKKAEALMLPDPDLQSWCHPMVHGLGHFIYNQYQDIGQAIEAGGEAGVVCASGLYHGVVEEAAEKAGLEELEAIVPTVCMPFATNKYSVIHYNCVHGLGHGLSAAHLDDWRAALVDCRRLANNWEHYSCASGVFMQNIVNRNIPGHTADFRADDPKYPCSDVDPYWSDACWINQTSYLVDYFKEDWKKILETCSSIDKLDQPYCYRSTGRDLVGRHRGNDEKIISSCLLVEAGAEKCLVGAAETYSYDTHDIIVGTKLCDAAPERFRDKCQFAVSEFLNQGQ